MKYVKKYEEFILEDVAERRFKLDPEFSDFDKQYKRMKNIEDQEIVYKDRKVVIIKNPKKLDNIAPSARGIIDYNGNLFIEQDSTLIHSKIVLILEKLGIIKTDKNLVNGYHINFITIQRQGDTNTIKIGESEEFYGKFIKILNDYQPFLNKAKIKNPHINFKNEFINNNNFWNKS